jgi:hypothetical protein
MLSKNNPGQFSDHRQLIRQFQTKSAIRHLRLVDTRPASDYIMSGWCTSGWNMRTDIPVSSWCCPFDTKIDTHSNIPLPSASKDTNHHGMSNSSDMPKDIPFRLTKLQMNSLVSTRHRLLIELINVLSKLHFCVTIIPVALCDQSSLASWLVCTQSGQFAIKLWYRGERLWQEWLVRILESNIQ